jgi:hypothetical protein
MGFVAGSWLLGGGLLGGVADGRCWSWLRFAGRWLLGGGLLRFAGRSVAGVGRWGWLLGGLERRCWGL